MIILEAETNAQATATRMVRVTPEGLRTIAERLERLAEAGTLPGEFVTYRVLSGITLVYDPGLSTTAHKAKVENERLMDSPQTFEETLQ